MGSGPDEPDKADGPPADDGGIQDILKRIEDVKGR
jgi:hypothetical protein